MHHGVTLVEQAVLTSADGAGQNAAVVRTELRGVRFDLQELTTVLRAGFRMWGMSLPHPSGRGHEDFDEYLDYEMRQKGADLGPEDGDDGEGKGKAKGKEREREMSLTLRENEGEGDGDPDGDGDGDGDRSENPENPGREDAA